MAGVSMRWGRRSPHYRRRRPVPGLLLLGTLVVISGFVWTQIFGSTEDIETATTCNQPGKPTAAPGESVSAEPPELGKMLQRDALNRTDPIPPQDVHVRVLNGNGESKQASLVSEELNGLGFSPGGEAADDAIYANYDLNCHGQIRFGGPGAGAARTMSLVAPCAQLVRDDRNDSSVDFALGSEFDDIKTTTEAKRVLQELKTKVPGEERGDAKQNVRQTEVDGELLDKARDVHC